MMLAFVFNHRDLYYVESKKLIHYNYIVLSANYKNAQNTK